MPWFKEGTYRHLFTVQWFALTSVARLVSVPAASSKMRCSQAWAGGPAESVRAHQPVEAAGQPGLSGQQALHQLAQAHHLLIHSLWRVPAPQRMIRIPLIFHVTRILPMSLEGGLWHQTALNLFFHLKIYKILSVSY